MSNNVIYINNKQNIMKTDVTIFKCSVEGTEHDNMNKTGMYWYI